MAMAELSPEVKKIMISPVHAKTLRQAAENLPSYDGKVLYSLDVQSTIHHQIRQANSDAFDSLIAQIKTHLAQRPYYALVHGLQFDHSYQLFVAINRAFGDLVAGPYEPPRRQLVHHIYPEADLEASRGKKYETEKLHTDTADWENPIKWLSMVCIKPDQNRGGHSQILDIHSVQEEIKKHLGNQILEWSKSQPMPWQLADYRGGGVEWRPVFTGDSMCWRRYTINDAIKTQGIDLSPNTISTLDSLETVIENAPGKLEFLMSDGELLFLDNHRALHARTPITPNSVRFMIRSWIKIN